MIDLYFVDYYYANCDYTKSILYVIKREKLFPKL